MAELKDVLATNENVASLSVKGASSVDMGARDAKARFYFQFCYIVQLFIF